MSRVTRPVLAWALYDWANSAFALSVITAFVPVMLAGHWNDGAPSTVTTFRLGVASALASLAVVLLAPLLGALTDRRGGRKAWLLGLTAAGVVATAGLALPGTGQWGLALGLFGLASVAFFASNSLYDALLVEVAAARDYDRVSALGYALGYLGGALLFTLNVAMLLAPARFGLADATAAMQASFLTVAAWWLLFSLPLARHVRERATAPPPALVSGFAQLRATLRSLAADRNLLLFLAAYWLYIDGVYTIIKMAVDYGLSQGLSSADVTTAILLTNFIGFPAAIAFGWLGGRIGTRRGIYLALAVYIVATAAAVTLSTPAEFYALAAAIGCVQGGVQSLSRSLYARLVPPERNGEYFGFYNLLGKFSSVLGPVLAGGAALATGSQRYGILSILILFIAGLALLVRVRLPAPEPVP
jgi:UMF1 family MFS transporter